MTGRLTSQIDKGPTPYTENGAELAPYYAKIAGLPNSKEQSYKAVEQNAIDKMTIAAAEEGFVSTATQKGTLTRVGKLMGIARSGGVTLHTPYTAGDQKC